MNKLIILIFVYLIFNSPVFSYSGELYTSPNCEFTVEFKNKYQIKTLYLPSGETVEQASSKTKNGGRLAAECYSSTIEIDDYIKYISTELKNRGATVFNVQNSDHMGIESVVATGSLNVEDGLLYIKIISFFGSTSRLDLIQIEDIISSKESLNFRNSVRLK